MENHLYECLYNILRGNLQPAEKLCALNRYKTKLVRLNANRPRKSLLDLADKDILDEETPTLYQVLRVKRRQDARSITHIKDENGITHRTQKGMVDTFPHTSETNISPLIQTRPPPP
jgi:hypothetical protein